MDRVRRRLSIFAKIATAAVMVTTFACSDEGLIVQVTRDDVTPAALDSLTFVVATRQSSGTNSVWVMDTTSSVTVQLESDDLLDEPYRLFLRNGTKLGAGAEVLVAVFASAGGLEVAFGKFSQPQRFMSGKVLVREITLEGYVGDMRPYVRDAQGCLGWTLDEGMVGESAKIATVNDKDCDGDPATADCDDFDPRVGTNKPEACDGLATSCGTKEPAPKPCYGRFPDVCNFGFAPCTDDTVLGGVTGECQLDPSEPSTSVPERFCIAYDECTSNLASDPFGCATVIAATTVPCVIKYDATTEQICDSAPAALFSPAAIALDCSWAIVNGQTQAHYKVGLTSPFNITPSPEIGECDVHLQVLLQLDPIPQPDVIWLGWLADGVGQPVRVDITPDPVSDCPVLELGFHCGP